MIELFKKGAKVTTVDIKDKLGSKYIKGSSRHRTFRGTSAMEIEEILMKALGLKPK